MPFSRTVSLVGEEKCRKLSAAKVAVFGLGGVGSYAAEALARSGVGTIALFDADTVSPSNLNRQLVALHSTIGRSKVSVMRERILDINPACNVRAHEVFYLPENADCFPLSAFDAVADAIDTVSAKIELAVRAEKEGFYLVSAMGTGNKLDPSRFEAADLFQTSVCPLARVMRRELKARGIKRLRVVYSKKEPKRADTGGERPAPASISFVPPVAGMLLAGEIIRYLMEK